MSIYEISRAIHKSESFSLIGLGGAEKFDRWISASAVFCAHFSILSTALTRKKRKRATEDDGPAETGAQGDPRSGDEPAGGEALLTRSLPWKGRFRSLLRADRHRESPDLRRQDRLEDFTSQEAPEG